MKILIVEDEKEIADFLRQSLAAEMFVTDVAHDGEKGAALAKINPYDLIILDNVLPKKNGLSVCQEIRAAKLVTPILILSAQSNTDLKIDLLNAGADDYLIKPFALEELLARVRALLRRPPLINEDILHCCNLSLNIKSQTLIKNKKEIYLTRKEFQLFEYLLRNKGIVLSRGMIMEHVWDMNADPFSNTIESHVLSLRRKIGDKDARKIIKTVPGRGYTISSNS